VVTPFMFVLTAVPVRQSGRLLMAGLKLRLSQES
jgi:hypothetical protein